MKQFVLATALCLAIAASASAQVIISEVIDGDLAGGNPKVVEITNLGCDAYVFADGCELVHYFNGSVTPGTTVDLSGVTIPARGSITVVSTQGAGDVAYQTAYGDDADIYTGSSFHNGDDTIRIECDSVVLDAYGEFGIDGSGTAWEYADGYAYSLPTRAPNGGAFDVANWFVDNGALDAPNDAARIAALQSLTTPKIHETGLEPCVAVPTMGAVGMISLTTLLLAAGAVVLRRN